MLPLVHVPQSLPAVETAPKNDVLEGEAITVMGYPGISPDVSVVMNSQDPLNRKGEVRQIPKPTVTSGSIGNVITGNAVIHADWVSSYYSEAGDLYQLTVNATGHGNSGGPVFNDKGHVIGIYTYGKSDQSGTAISFAVPIKYGREIMGLHQLIE